MKAHIVFIGVAFFLTITDSRMTFANVPIAPVPRYGKPAYGGSGCPQGVGRIDVSPDGQTLDFELGAISVETGSETTSRVGRKTCNISIPVQVPEGYRIALPVVTVKGANELPVGSYAEVDTETFFSGMRGPRESKRFEGPLRTSYTAMANSVDTTRSWSPCGVDFNLRVNMSVRVGSHTTNRIKASATVDTIDLGMNRLRWIRCE